MEKSNLMTPFAFFELNQIIQFVIGYLKSTSLSGVLKGSRAGNGELLPLRKLRRSIGKKKKETKKRDKLRELLCGMLNIELVI